MNFLREGVEILFHILLPLKYAKATIKKNKRFYKLEEKTRQDRNFWVKKEDVSLGQRAYRSPAIILFSVIIQLIKC